MRPILFFTVGPLLATPACAWGTVGHETVAYIAQNFVSSATASYVQEVLGSSSTSYMASVATWADSYRYTDAGEFSAPFHYIDALDSPPESCGVDYERDCTDAGCSISAINNYTNILLNGEDLNAMRFVIHFIGDLHQPLHDENLEVGGNTIEVTFDGTVTNLHHIWDTDMITKLTGGTSLATAETWATTLTEQINSGDYASLASSWTSGIDISDPIATSMTWANEANSYICSNVLAQGEDYVEENDLGGTYYENAVPVIELQIARGGYRLAAWLDLIATGSLAL